MVRPFILADLLSPLLERRRALLAGFVEIDDGLYVTENRHVRTGLSAANIRWAFLNGEAYLWHPLTWLSHMLDCQLYGLAPGGHHITSVLLHAANTVLVFAVLVRLTKASWPSAIVAALFGLHPLRVESVAWVAERKDVLSGLFCLLTLWAYAEHATRPSPRRLGLVALLFTAGLMAKCSAMPCGAPTNRPRKRHWRHSPTARSTTPTTASSSACRTTWMFIAWWAQWIKP